MRRTILTLVAIAAFAFQVPAGAATKTMIYRGVSGTYAGDQMRTTGVATSTCKTTYCARFYAGRRDRSVTISLSDDASPDVLFAVGSDKNRDGDATDSGEYKVFCSTGRIRVAPRAIVDVQVLAGATSGCASAPTQGVIEAVFRR